MIWTPSAEKFIDKISEQYKTTYNDIIADAVAKVAKAKLTIEKKKTSLNEGEKTVKIQHMVEHIPNF